MTRPRVACSVGPKQVDSPLAAQAASLHRQREGKHSETVCLLTSLPELSLSPPAWFTHNDHALGH
jgi:hypothetical protein